MDWYTTEELSKIWNISARRIGVLCANGRVTGAIKKGKTWLIPVLFSTLNDASFFTLNGAISA